MLTKHDEDFINYWAVQRLKKKQFLRKLSIGLPLAVVIVSALFLNFLSGWHEDAEMIIKRNTSVIIVVLIAVIGIVIFITMFSARFKWDQNEQHYLELLKRKQEESVQQVGEI